MAVSLASRSGLVPPWHLDDREAGPERKRTVTSDLHPGSGRAVSTLGRIDLAAAAEGALLGAYTFTSYRSGTNGKAPVGSIELVSDATDAATTIRTAAAVATAVRTTRDLVNTPPNDLYP